MLGFEEKVQLRLPSKLKAKLERKARKLNKTVSQVVRDLVEGLEDDQDGLEVGQRIDTSDWATETSYTAKIGYDKFHYFPEKGVVAVVKRSGNWSRKWYELVLVLDAGTKWDETSWVVEFRAMSNPQTIRERVFIKAVEAWLETATFKAKGMMRAMIRKNEIQMLIDEVRELVEDGVEPGLFDLAYALDGLA